MCVSDSIFILSVKQGIGIFLLPTLNRDGRAREKSSTLLGSDCGPSSKPRAVMLPCDNAGQSVLSFYRQVISWGRAVIPDLWFQRPPSSWLRSQRGRGLPDAPPTFPLQRRPRCPGAGLGPGGGPLAGRHLPPPLFAAPSSPPNPACTGEEAGTPGPLSLGSPAATAAAPLAFLRVLIEWGAQPLAPLSPEMS